MRIAIAGQTYDTRTNGQGVFTVHLAERLARRGHTVMTFKPSERGPAYRATLNGVQVEALRAVSLAPFYPQVFVTPWPRRAAGLRLDQFRPDIIHIQDHYPLCRGVLGAARARGLPVLGSNHFLPENMAPAVPFSRFGRAAVDRILWWTALAVLNRVKTVTTPTETAASILRGQRIGVPVQAISCGVDLAGFFPNGALDRAAMRRRYGLDPSRTLFLYLGRLDPEKRIDVLIHAFRQLNRPDLQLAVAGQGRDHGALQALAAPLLPDRRVVFTGFVPSADLPGLLNSADIFAMPSEAELQSIATLEAMATGRPVLAANARALPELVEENTNGHLFRAGDVEDACRQIVRLADHPELWASMGAASLVRARRHDLDRTVERYVQLYHELCGSSAPEVANPEAPGLDCSKLSLGNRRK